MRCETEGCDAPPVLRVVVTPLRSSGVASATYACADHAGESAEQVAALVLLANGFVEPTGEAERDVLALIQEHLG